MNAKRVVDEIFPQLAESEDERMLMAVISGINELKTNCGWEEIDGINMDHILAWLEKRKENPKSADSIQSDCVSDAKWASSVLTNAIVSLSDAVDYNCNEPFRYKQEIYDLKKLREEIEKQKEQKSHLTVKGKGVYKICPRCKSRMIRDDSKVYTSMPPRYGYNCPKCGTMEFDTVMYDNPEMDEQIIDSAPLYTIEQVDEKVREAQEWSEEDKKKISELKTFIALCKGFNKANRQKAFNMIDALRPPQYCENCKLKRSVENWKPSEEQMNALSALNCHGDLSYVGQQKQLISLYNDLKKLI